MLRRRNVQRVPVVSAQRCRFFFFFLIELFQSDSVIYVIEKIPCSLLILIFISYYRVYFFNNININICDIFHIFSLIRIIREFKLIQISNIEIIIELINIEINIIKIISIKSHSHETILKIGS